MAKKKYIRSFLIWRYRHISDSHFKHILSVLIGLLSGLAAVSLKNLTHIIQEFLTRDFISELRNTWYFVLPLLGLTTVFLIIKYGIKKPIFQGIPSTIYAISKKKGFLSNYQGYASIITAPLTIGFGGSVGLESPTVATAASWSSALSRLFHLDQKTRILLIGCAAAGAMASIFKAPITAIVFAIEIFSLELTTASLIPLLLASISAVLTSYFFFGNDVLFHVRLVSVFELQDLGFYAILGVICAFVSIYFSKALIQINNWFKNISSPLKRLFIGGSLLGLVIFFIPPLYGEGYDTINSVLAGETLNVIRENFFGMEIGGFASIVALLLGLILFKVIAMGLTMGAGGIGGVFAPTLFTGSITGYLVAYTVNSLGTFQNNLSETSFAMVGMAGLVAGILQAPLTAIFLIAEITEGYELFVPLMIVTTISYLITKQYVPYNIYVSELAKKGQLITHNRDNNALLLMSTDQVIEQNFIEIKPEMFLREMLENAVSKSNRNIFPVVNDQREFIGIVLLDDIRTIMFDSSLHEKVRVSELMHAAPGIIIYEEDNMQAIMQKFKTSGAWNLPVIKKGRYHGFISKSKLLSAYRTKLLQVSAS